MAEIAWAEENYCLLCCQGNHAWGKLDVCPACRADAELGRLVRGMPPASILWRVDDGWICLYRGLQGKLPTPREALKAAGLVEKLEPGDDAP